MGKTFTAFTDKSVAAAKPGKERRYIREGRGFALRIMPDGLKTFYYIYELNKVKRYLPLGTYPACSLAEARKQYNQNYNLVKNGIDPFLEKERLEQEQKIAEEQAALTAQAAERETQQIATTFQQLLEEGVPEGFVPKTVEQLAAVWMVNYARENHSERWQGTELSCIQLHLLPAMGKEEIGSIRSRHALSLIEGIAKTAPGSARNTMKLCRQMFKYALRKEWAEFQPFTEITQSVPKIAQKADERHLDDLEIIKLWKSVDASAMSPLLKRALKLILVTAQRPGEVAQLQRNQISGRWWTIPAEVAKNRREHRVYLTDTALKLIGTSDGYIFPSDKGDQPFISTNSLSQAINRDYQVDSEGRSVNGKTIRTQKQKYFGMAPWSPQDLRRTARTNMARVSVSDDIGEEVINHKKRGIIGVYNKFRYDPQKKMALTRWERLLLRILEGKTLDPAP